MITAAIFCTAIAVYGLYCVSAPDEKRMGRWALAMAVVGVMATMLAPIFATIAVNR